MIRFFFIFYTHTHIHIATHTTDDGAQCSWHGELIKMMFSLRGALRFFALLWLFNLLFAMLVIAFTHSSPTFCNGSSYSSSPSPFLSLLTNTHTTVPLLHMESFSFFLYISMGLLRVSNPLRALTNDWKHPSPSSKIKSRRKSAVMSAKAK